MPELQEVKVTVSGTDNTEMSTDTRAGGWPQPALLPSRPCKGALLSPVGQLHTHYMCTLYVRMYTLLIYTYVCVIHIVPEDIYIEGRQPGGGDLRGKAPI